MATRLACKHIFFFLQDCTSSQGLELQIEVTTLGWPLKAARNDWPNQQPQGYVQEVLI